MDQHIDPATGNLVCPSCGNNDADALYHADRDRPTRVMCTRCPEIVAREAR